MEYYVTLEPEDSKKMTKGRTLEIALDDGNVLLLSKKVKRKDLESYREYNRKYYAEHKKEIQARRKYRRDNGLSPKYDRSEYNRWYYENVVKPRREEQKQCK